MLLRKERLCRSPSLLVSLYRKLDNWSHSALSIMFQCLQWYIWICGNYSLYFMSIYYGMTFNFKMLLDAFTNANFKELCWHLQKPLTPKHIIELNLLPIIKTSQHGWWNDLMCFCKQIYWQSSKHGDCSGQIVVFKFIDITVLKVVTTQREST